MRRALAWLVGQLAVPFVLVGGLLMACEEDLRGQDTLLISDSVLAELGALADTATIEHAACLLWARTGVITADSEGRPWPQLEVMYVLYPPQGEPPPPFTRRTGVARSECPIGTVIDWHNHILAVTDSLFHRYGWMVPDSLKRQAARACVLSRADWKWARTDVALFTMIQVDRRTFCWWHRGELYQPVAPDYALPFFWWPIHVNAPPAMVGGR